MQYFIEQFRDMRNSPLTAFFSPGLLPISQLDKALKLTSNSLVLKTIAVCKITLKPGVIMCGKMLTDSNSLLEINNVESID